MKTCATFRTSLTFCFFLGVAFAGSSAPSPVLTGTVNIILANVNGIVTLTDSNQTGKLSSGELITSPVPGQKLFRIDDRTALTIAGFGVTSLPRFPEFSSSAAGVVDSYVEELRSKDGAHTFREKLTSLAFLFQQQLDGIVSLQHLDESELKDYGLEAILAGYDTDGTGKIGKIIIDVSVTPNGDFLPMIKQITEKTVGRELVVETAGIGGSAVQNILVSPGLFADEPEIGRYAASMKADHGSSLTVPEVVALAKSLSHHAAAVNYHNVIVGYYYVKGGFRKFWPVGGRNQIAILNTGSAPMIDQPTFLFQQRRLNMKPFSIVSGFTFDTNGVPGVAAVAAPARVIGLFVRTTLIGDARLDNVYYFEDDFRNGTLHYDGGSLGFDPSNRVTNCILSLGPKVNTQSADVQELISGFHWKAVLYRH